QTQTYILRHLLFSTLSLFFFSATTTSQIYTLSLHDALPIYKHNLNFLITGAPQWHNQNFANSISNYLKYGRKYNSNWGYLNGEAVNDRTNYYHKPVMNLNWDWIINDRSSLSTVLYASWGRGGGTGPID